VLSLLITKSVTALVLVLVYKQHLLQYNMINNCVSKSSELDCTTVLNCDFLCIWVVKIKMIILMYIFKLCFFYIYLSTVL
jgi:hypothetical protein